jgi:hypothetical protein
MGRTRKTLYQLAIRDRTFAARRHVSLLDEEPILDDEPHLAELQKAYRAAVHPLERKELALEFQRAVRQPRPPPPPRELSYGEGLNLFSERMNAFALRETPPERQDELFLVPPVPLALANGRNGRRAAERFLQAARAAWLYDKGLSLPEIAEQLSESEQRNVSTRTIRRYFDFLEHWGGPGRPRKESRAGNRRRGRDRRTPGHEPIM